MCAFNNSSSVLPIFCPPFSKPSLSFSYRSPVPCHTYPLRNKAFSDTNFKPATARTNWVLYSLNVSHVLWKIFCKILFLDMIGGAEVWEVISKPKAWIYDTRPSSIYHIAQEAKTYNSIFLTTVNVSKGSTILTLSYKQSKQGKEWRWQKNKEPLAKGRKDFSINKALLHFAFKEFLYSSKDSMKYICVGKHKNASIFLLCSLCLGLKELDKNCCFQQEADPDPNR